MLPRATDRQSFPWSWAVNGADQGSGPVFGVIASNPIVYEWDLTDIERRSYPTVYKVNEMNLNLELDPSYQRDEIAEMT